MGGGGDDGPLRLCWLASASSKPATGSRCFRLLCSAIKSTASYTHREYCPGVYCPSAHGPEKHTRWESSWFGFNHRSITRIWKNNNPYTLPGPFEQAGRWRAPWRWRCVVVYRYQRPKDAVARRTPHTFAGKVVEVTKGSAFQHSTISVLGALSSKNSTHRKDKDKRKKGSQRALPFFFCGWWEYGLD